MIKKIGFILIMCLALAFCFTGCSKDEGGEPQNTATPEPTKETSNSGEENVTPAVTEEATPTVTEEPTPTSEPTVTEEPTPTEEPEVTAEPTATEIPEGPYADEDIQYDTPSLLNVGMAVAEDAYYDEEGNKHAYVEYELVTLPDDDKKAYPELALGIDVFNMGNTDSAQKCFTELSDMAKGDPSFTGLYFMYDKYDILRADSYVLSLKGTNSTYSGGVHPYTGQSGVSFDVQTGERLKLSDICNDCDSLASMLPYRLAGKYDLWDDESNFETLQKYVEEKAKNDEISFTVGYDGVTFYFAPYEIASYADGNLFVTIPYVESFPAETATGPKMVGLFKKKYRTVPENYMITYTLGDKIDLPDVYGLPESFTTFSAYGDRFDEYNSRGLGICLGEKEIFKDESVDFYHDLSNFNFVKVNGHIYFVAFVTFSSDDNATYVYEIEDGKVRIADVDGYSKPSLRYFVGPEEWDYLLANKTVSDPSVIKLVSRHDVIGTTFETANYRFAESGRLEKVDKYYDFRNRQKLTLKKPFKAGMIDPEQWFNSDSGVGGELDIEIELSEGDNIYLEKTDGEYVIFFSTDSGEWGMFELNDSSTVHGEDITDVFDGISFAD